MKVLTRPFNFILLGPPGAGKGTQAALLSKAFDLVHVSTGDILRESIKDGGETGLKAKSFMEAGELVPDEIVTRAVIERMHKDDASRGVILDGYPRTCAQSDSLQASLEEDDRKVDIVLYLSTSEETSISRLSGRRVCKECGKNYHVSNMPPDREGVCDDCDAALIQRDDDKPDTIKNRLLVYEQSTKDLISYYEEKGLLKEVNGDTQAADLFVEIKALFIKEGLVDDDPEGS